MAFEQSLLKCIQSGPQQLALLKTVVYKGLENIVDIRTLLTDCTTSSNNQQKIVKLNGKLYTACTNNRESPILVFESSDDGVTWSQIHSNIGARYPALVGMGNNLYMFYNKTYNPGYVGVYWQYYDGSSWSTEQRISQTTHGGTPVALVDSNGYFHILWNATYSTTIKYLTNRSGLWVQFDIPNTNANLGQITAVMDELNTIHVIYAYNINVSRPLYYFTINANTSEYSIQAELPKESGKTHSFPNIRIFNGVLEATFVEYSPSPDTWKIKTINAALDVTTVYAKSASSSQYLRSPILVGNYCFWHDSTGTIYYSVNTVDGWSAATVLESGRDVCGLNEGNANHVCWCTGTNFRYVQINREFKKVLVKRYIKII